MVIGVVLAIAVFLPMDAANFAQSVDVMKDLASAVLLPVVVSELVTSLIAGVVIAQGAPEQASLVMLFKMLLYLLVAHHFIALRFFFGSLCSNALEFE